MLTEVVSEGGDGMQFSQRGILAKQIPRILKLEKVLLYIIINVEENGWESAKIQATCFLYLI